MREEKMLYVTLLQIFHSGLNHLTGIRHTFCTVHVRRSQRHATFGGGVFWRRSKAFQLSGSQNKVLFCLRDVVLLPWWS